MKNLFPFVFIFFLASCFEVRQCKDCTLSNGIIRNTRIERVIVIPNWNDSVLIFVNGKSQKRDTFFVEEKKLEEVDRSNYEIEISSQDFIDIGLTIRRKGDVRNYGFVWGQYSCKEDKYELNISWLDFWDWGELVNERPTDHSSFERIDQLKIGKLTISEVLAFTPNLAKFPSGSERDIQKIFWHHKLGIIQFESKSTGNWSRDFF